MKNFGKPLSFPLPIEGDWARIHCGVDGNPNYIFGTEGLKEFYDAGAGIYSRKNGKPSDSYEHWLEWYNKEKEERIAVMRGIKAIKEILILKYSKQLSQ